MCHADRVPPVVLAPDDQSRIADRFKACFDEGRVPNTRLFQIGLPESVPPDWLPDGRNHFIGYDALAVKSLLQVASNNALIQEAPHQLANQRPAHQLPNCWQVMVDAAR